jgi:hypothetical protein
MPPWAGPPGRSPSPKLQVWIFLFVAVKINDQTSRTGDMPLLLDGSMAGRLICGALSILAGKNRSMLHIM